MDWFFSGSTKRERRDAARLAVQSAAAAAAMYLLMRSLGWPEQFVGVLSAVLVVQPSVGDTLGVARDRFVATIVGSVIGILCLILLPKGYGTAVALGLSMLVMNGLAGFKPQWRYGTVAAVAMALGSDGNFVETAQARALAIGVGALLGALVSFAVWPDTADKRAKRHLRSALLATAERLDAAVESARSDEQKSNKDVRRRYHSNIESARAAAEVIRFGQPQEMLAIIDLVAKLYNSVLVIDRVAEETNHATDVSSDLEDAVEVIREIGCSVTKALADGDLSQQKDLDRIWEALELARREVAGSGGEPRDHTLRNAMVFGLGEIADSLKELHEALAERED